MYICTKCYATLDANERKCPVCGGAAVPARKASSQMPSAPAPYRRKTVYQVRKCGSKELVEEFDSIVDARRLGMEKGYYIEVILKMIKNKSA